MLISFSSRVRCIIISFQQLIMIDGGGSSRRDFDLLHAGLFAALATRPVWSSRTIQRGKERRTERRKIPHHAVTIGIQAPEPLRSEKRALRNRDGDSDNEANPEANCRIDNGHF